MGRVRFRNSSPDHLIKDMQPLLKRVEETRLEFLIYIKKFRNSLIRIKYIATSAIQNSANFLKNFPSQCRRRRGLQGLPRSSSHESTNQPRRLQHLAITCDVKNKV